MEKLKLERLVQKIEKQEKTVKEINEFVEEITRGIGKEDLYSESSGHTHIIRTLDNFQGFSFCANTGQTMFGGEDYSVWYSKNRTQTPVFSVHYQDGKYAVKEFKKDTEWLKKLQKIMKNKKSILAKMEKEKEKQRIKILLQKEQKNKRKQLLEDAKVLKL